MELEDTAAKAAPLRVTNRVRNQRRGFHSDLDNSVDRQYLLVQDPRPLLANFIGRIHFVVCAYGFESRNFDAFTDSSIARPIPATVSS